MSENINALSSEAEGGQLDVFKNNLQTIKKKGLGSACVRKDCSTPYDSQLITFFQTDAGEDFNLKEFTVAVQHNLSTKGYNGAQLVITALPKRNLPNTTWTEPVTLGVFPVQAIRGGTMVCMAQARLCGNLMTQCNYGYPGDMSVMSTMYGGWTTKGVDPLGFNEGAKSLNWYIANRTQCTETIKEIQIYLQLSSGERVAIPANTYLYVDIYGVQN